MAELIEDKASAHEINDARYGSKTKTDWALGLGIVGTALAGMTALGGGICKALDNRRCDNYDGYGRRDCYNHEGFNVGFHDGIGVGLAMNSWRGGFGFCNGYGNGFYNNAAYSFHNADNASSMTSEDLYIERKQAQNFIDTTKEYYEGKLQGQKDLANAFFDAYKRDVDNSFMLYKGYRDADDKTNHRMTDIAFNLYKNQRDEKDCLNEKINHLQNKLDVIAAIRPYQDALINAKIDKNAIISDFNLSKRTCKMIEGQLVLPNDPTVTGYPSLTYGNR